MQCKQYNDRCLLHLLSNNFRRRLLHDHNNFRRRFLHDRILVCLHGVCMNKQTNATIYIYIYIYMSVRYRLERAVVTATV